jgi:hypothetical protein
MANRANDQLLNRIKDVVYYQKNKFTGLGLFFLTVLWILGSSYHLKILENPSLINLATEVISADGK